MNMDARIQETKAASAAGFKKRGPWRRRILMAPGILAVAAIAWFLFAPQPVKVELATVVQGPMQVTIDDEGQVRAHDKYVVAAPVAGALERNVLRDGDPVRKDEVVATLRPLPLDPRERQEAMAQLDAAKALAREASLQAQRANADLMLAVSERQRTERLVRNNFLSRQAEEKAEAAEKMARAAWEAARFRERAAQADVKAAEAALFAITAPPGQRQIALTAPVDGYVLRVHEKSERTIPAGTPLITIGDPRRYEIVVDVLSTDAVKVRPGDTMLLEGWGGGKVLRARVRLVEPVAFTKISALGVEEQRVNIVADPVDDLGQLGDGYRVEARIVIWARDKVVKAPGSSLFRVGDAWHVFVLDGGRVHERGVTIGQRNQDEVQLLSGVTVGTQLVRYPSNQLKDGVRVVAER
jgi:HlyD family secretion protein